MVRIAYVSTYVPKRCGLATYTFHLRQAVNGAKAVKGIDRVVAVTDRRDDDHRDPVLWSLEKDNIRDYAEMARKINNSDVDVVSLQHEFGIFGGEAGSYILEFVRNLRKPLITTFHTVFEHPEPPYAPIQKELAERSDKIIVMNRKAIGFLHRSFDVPTDKIRFIPHGSPEPASGKREAYRRQLGWENRNVLMTFGLLSRGKGIEFILDALPDVVKKVPYVLYAVVGQTHPEVKKREGEAYREQLQEKIRRLGISDHVTMIDKYMEEKDLIQLLMSCDVYITPYPGMQQITSGTLAYAVGLGRPVLTTPYCYAQDLLRGFEELLIPYGERKAWTDKIVALLSDERARAEWETKIAEVGKQLHWPQVGKKHLELFEGVSRVAPVR